jgi:hypothetical protein
MKFQVVQWKMKKTEENKKNGNFEGERHEN